MENIIKSLENLLKNDTKYHKKEEIIKALNIKGEEQEKILNSALITLEEEGIIFSDKKNEYKIFPTKSGYAYGEIEITKSGTGFVHTNDGFTILIEASDLNGALNGDSVIVNNIYSKRKDYYSGEIEKITKRKNGNVIFEVIGTGTSASIIPYNLNEFVNVDIDNSELKKLIDGDIISVKVGCKSYNNIFKGTISKIIGNKNDLNIDIKLIAEKYDIPTTFSKEILDEVKCLPKEVPVDEIKNRVDLREENIFTIDCDNTKDRDDAVGIRKLDNGNYLLKVNIAHVSHYVKNGMKSFDEAINRCFSHYPGNEVIPMLEPTISNGICSLNPGVDRLTRTVEIEIDSLGNIINYKIYNSVINSKMAMSYSNVNKVLNGEYVENYEKYKNDLNLMKELNSILSKVRDERNYINFDTLELIVNEDKNGKIKSFNKNNYDLAGEIIENFMLIANEIVYQNYSWFPLPYRIHEEPNEKNVKEILDILRISGFKLPKLNNVDSKSLKNLLLNLKDDQASLIAKEYLLKSMKKAKYDIKNIGHFALQYDTYGHFTSPIRRITDLMIHTIIDNIENFEYTEENIHKFEEYLNQICEKANRIEKIDKIIENETLEMLMAEYMEDKIGNSYEAYITDIDNHSLLLRTKEYILGKLKFTDMKDDQYHYDIKNHSVVGRNNKKKYNIGNKIYVIVKDASKENRTVNFEIPNEKVLKK